MNRRTDDEEFSSRGIVTSVHPVSVFEKQWEEESRGKRGAYFTSSSLSSPSVSLNLDSRDDKHDSP